MWHVYIADQAPQCKAGGGGEAELPQVARRLREDEDAVHLRGARHVVHRKQVGPACTSTATALILTAVRLTTSLKSVVALHCSVCGPDSALADRFTRINNVGSTAVDTMAGWRAHKLRDSLDPES
jgi:hypothetical protein